jgi:hypothetical protein
MTSSHMSTAPPPEHPTTTSTGRMDWLSSLLLFFPASFAASYYGGQVQTLRLPFASFAITSHVWMVFCFLILPLIVSGWRARLLRFLPHLLGIVCLMSPMIILKCGAVDIPLKPKLTQQEQREIASRFHFPTVISSSSSKGQSLYLRRSDYTPTVKQTLQDLGLLANDE